MSHKMDDIYREFLSNIDDYALTLNERDEVSLLEELFGHYKFARRKFSKSRADLGTNYQSHRDVPEGEEMLINDSLSYQEVDIIIHLMLVSYLRPVINSNKVLRQALTDKDFNLTSQANHLNQLTIWYRRLQSEADRAMTKYTYRRLGE